MIITRNPSAYAVSDGMTPCGFRDCAVAGPTVAVHILRESLPVAPAGTHLCAFHSPYDVIEVPDPAPLVICTRPLTAGRAVSTPGYAEAILRERMRLSGVRFRRGFARGVMRAEYPGGPLQFRRLLPLV